MPASATLTYAADDYFYFYINGNQVVNGTFFDAGNPPQTVAIPPAYFNGSGTNYFAAQVRNSVANLIGATWVISITCANGNLSYITSSDSTFTMYNDVGGSSPPPANGGNQWYQPAWVDAGNIFNQTPIQAPPLSWFSPIMTHPITGAQLPVLSHSPSATQGSLAQSLYFRETVTLIEITPTPSLTPTLSPTPYPPGCGPPVRTDSRNVAQTCFNASNTIAYTVPALSNMLVIRIERGNAGNPTAVTYNGVPLTFVRNDATYSGGYLATYYLANPTIGANNLVINFAGSGCSWNVGAETYRGVDTATPIGATSTQGGSSQNFTTSLTSVGPASVLSDFLAIEQVYSGAVMSSLGAGQTSHGFTSGCCDEVYGDYKTVGPPGPQTMSYNLTQSKQWRSQLIEIRGPACVVSTPTRTATRTRTLTLTSTRTATQTLTLTRTPTPPITPTFTQSRTATRTLTLTSSSTHSATPTRTLTRTPTATPTVSRTSSPSATLTATRTATPTSSTTLTINPSPTATRTSTRSASPSLTVSPTLTRTPSPTRSATISVTPTATPSATQSRTATVTVSQSFTPTRTPTRTVTSTVTVTPSQSFTPTQTRTVTISATPSLTLTRTASPTQTVTVSQSFTPSRTATSSASPTPSGTMTATGTSTRTLSRTPTSSSTPTSSASRTPTISLTATLTQPATPTRSPTITLSRTPTPTLTVTASQSHTPTATRTQTASSTMTLTLSRTPSPTATRTSTISLTATLTQPATATVTWTVTQTSSLTRTPSRTPTVTVTSSQTYTPSITRSATISLTATLTQPATATVTSTITLTATPSLTSTFTPTSSATLTRTPSSQDTPSFTPSATPTWTQTPSYSLTATRSDSPTQTLTRTATTSFTETALATATDSPSVTLSFSSSPTPTHTRTSTPSRTATPTHTPSPQSTDTPTPTASPSFSLTRTFTSTPSRTATRTLTQTYTSSATPSATPSSSATETAQPTQTFSPTLTATSTQTLSFTLPPTFTSSPTPVPMGFHLKVAIYNSAGEQVRHLYSGPSQKQPEGFQVRQKAVLPGMQSAILEFSGLLESGSNILLWPGSNDMGQPVSGGTYYVKIEESDPFGAVVSWTSEVSVIPPALRQSLNVYNSAGELVAQLDPASAGISGQIADFAFAGPAGSAFVPSPGSGVALVLTDAQGLQSPYSWNGRNSQGGPAALGSYTLRLVNQMPGGPVVVESRGFVLLKDAQSQAPLQVTAGPNPLGPLDKELVFAFNPLAPGQQAALKLYNLGGELIALGLSSPGSSRLVLEKGNWSSGVYVAVFELREGGSLHSRRLLRLAIQR